MSQTGDTIDLSRFHETFFQESLEGLSVMESGLLALADAVGGTAEPDTIHHVFRAAHSIKGGSATFGFEDIAGLTHHLETILGRAREGNAALGTDVLLESVDCLRELIYGRMQGRTPDSALLQRVKERLAAEVSSAPVAAPEAEKPAVSENPKAAHAFHISFRPGQRIFYSGNDPLLYLNQLGHAGRLENTADLHSLPHLSELNAEECYLCWDMSLKETPLTRDDVRGVFEWISDECELNVSDEKTSSDPPKRKPTAAKEGASLRVAASKVDSVINLVGELVITQSMLACIGDDFEMDHLPKLRATISQLERNTRELQDTVLKMRMLPVSNLFDRCPRLVHDLSRKLGKAVNLQISGGETEIDKTLLEKLSDPLVHLVRNSLDHGIESADERRSAGKPEEGVVRLHAEHKGGNVLIEVSDDGAGLDVNRILATARAHGLVTENQTLAPHEIHELIFEPSFSTAENVTDVSGRGVGMDVVRRNVQELNGHIEVDSKPGQGTAVRLLLPLTLAIMDGQLLQVGEERFVVPLFSIIESVRANSADMVTVGRGGDLYRWRGEYLRVVYLRDVFQVSGSCNSLSGGLLVIVEAQNERIALAVDGLLAQQQLVIKSLEANFGRVASVAGATILGDGTVAMIVDVAGIIEQSKATRAGS